jgi:hypothetical protein
MEWFPMSVAHAAVYPTEKIMAGGLRLFQVSFTIVDSLYG